MVETLRRLVNMASFGVLQDKLETWLDNYTVNTCDQNVNRCMEIIELNSRLQTQLVRLLSLTAAEGGVYGGAAVIKARLLPLLGNLYVGGATGVDDAALNALSEAAAKERELQQVQDEYETSLKSLEDDLTITKAEADQLKIELEEKSEQLEKQRRKSTTEKIFTDTEVNELRNRLRQLEDELLFLRISPRSTTADIYTRQINRLKDEIALLNARRTLATTASRCDDIFDDDVTPSQRYQQQKLITRYNEMFVRDRMDAMETLKQCNNEGDHHDNQRIVFAAVQESFNVTRRAFSEYKLRVRSTMSLTYSGSATLEQIVQDYISRHSELLETAEMVADVVRALNRKSSLVLPVGVSFMIIHTLIRESCKLAWGLFSLPRPLDIVPAASLELFDDTKYRRSFDSDSSAALVTHHIWPCLMQGMRVVAKGEAYAIRGGAMLTATRSRSPERKSLRSRSPSPVRTERGRSPLRSAYSLRS